MIKHKRLIVIAAIVILAGTGYGLYRWRSGSVAETRYITGTVGRGTLVVSVSGTGQVTSVKQVDLKPKASGDLTKVNVQVGQKVKAGDLIAQLDSSDAVQAVRDAEVSLETARLSQERLYEPPDDLSLLQSQNFLTQAQEAKLKAEDDLRSAYDDSYNTVSDAFLDFPGVISGLHDVLFLATASSSQANIDYYSDATLRYDDRATTFAQDARDTYDAARTAYDDNFETFKASSRASSEAELESLLDQTYEAAKEISEAIRAANNLIQFYQNTLIVRDQTPKSVSNTQLSSLNGYTGQINSHLSKLLSAKNSFKNSRDAIVGAERTIVERTASLEKLQAAPDPLDVRSQELSVQQRQTALADARAKLADYVVRAPFAGTVVAVNVEKGDAVSSGTAVATLVTDEQIIEITLNEVDVAQVKVGQPATVTFDALPDLTLTGSVAQVDAVGTTSQGVVNYGVQLSLDTQDERVKPGMSVSVAIIIVTKMDVLLVPNAAVKTANGGQYVEVLDEAQITAAAAGGVTSAVAPQRQTVEIGVANDESTEILSGLAEGQTIVVRTATSSAGSPTTGSTQGGNAVRIPMIGGGGFRPD